MAIFNRVSRMFKADVHAVIDQLEEPYLLLKQSIREMEMALAEDEKYLVLTENKYQDYQERLCCLEEALAKVDEELDICFQADNDDLARALIRKKLEQQKMCQMLQAKLKKTAEARMSIQSRIAQQLPQLESMKQKAEIFSRDSAQNVYENHCSDESLHVSREDVEVALLREKQKRA